MRHFLEKKLSFLLETTGGWNTFSGLVKHSGLRPEVWREERSASRVGRRVLWA